MKTLPSRLFPNCTFSAEKSAGFYDITPEGFDHVVSLFLDDEAVKDDKAIENAARFFDRVHEWDAFGRNAFMSAEEGSEDADMIQEYFDFFREEVPEVFDAEDVAALSVPDMVKKLKLRGMAACGNGDAQTFWVDFTLGYDQLLCVHFNHESKFDHIAWES
ncbi:MAG: hypothetical protein ACOYJB_05375 [Christensenellaceae bacterium]|jgi:hypothetical protein